MCAECLAVIRASANFSLIRGIMRHGILLACSHPPAPAVSCSSGWFHLSQRGAPGRMLTPSPGQLPGHSGPSSGGRHGGFALWLMQNEAVPSSPLAVHSSPCCTGFFCSPLSHSPPNTGLLTGSSFSSPSQSLIHLPSP